MICGRICWSIPRRDLVSLSLLFSSFYSSFLPSLLSSVFFLAFIRGLLENVGVEISPIRLIRRIKNGLEIPGLKEALIKILQDFHLQISLLEGCQTILNGDSSDLSRRLQRGQSAGFFLSRSYFSLDFALVSIYVSCDANLFFFFVFVWIATSLCNLCARLLQDTPQGLTMLFLCRHVVHATCVSGAEQLPLSLTPFSSFPGLDGGGGGRGLSGSIAL